MHEELLEEKNEGRNKFVLMFFINKITFFHILFVTAIHFFITLKYNANIVDPTYFWIGI